MVLIVGCVVYYEEYRYVQCMLKSEKSAGFEFRFGRLTVSLSSIAFKVERSFAVTIVSSTQVDEQRNAEPSAR